MEGGLGESEKAPQRLKIKVVFDDRTLFNHGLGVAAVVDQDPTRDRDIALKTHVTFDLQDLSFTATKI
jgi:hypothetical protein